MKHPQIDLLLWDETGSTAPQKKQEQEGSLQTIKIPQEKNSIESLKTEIELENELKKEKSKKTSARIPFGFFSHSEQNRTKYIYS